MIYFYDNIFLSNEKGGGILVKNMEIKEILEQLKENKLSIEQAEKELQKNQYEDLGFAKIDHNRKERVGKGEVVFCQNKPDEFLSKIYHTIYFEWTQEALGNCYRVYRGSDYSTIGFRLASDRLNYYYSTNISTYLGSRLALYIQ